MGTNFRQRADGGIGIVTDSTAEEVASFGGIYRGMKVAKVAIAGVAATTGGALFSWANPEGQSIIISRFQIDITTKSTGAAAGDFGVAANGTTTSDILIDGYALGGTEKVVDTALAADLGTNGKPVQKMTASQFITGTGSATTAGLVGNVFIHYFLA
jgi:hypothetical protein